MAEPKAYVEWLVHSCEVMERESKEFSEDFRFMLRKEAERWDIIAPGNPQPLLAGLIFCPFCSTKLP